jgi:hypothetical protein
MWVGEPNRLLDRGKLEPGTNKDRARPSVAHPLLSHWSKAILLFGSLTGKGNVMGNILREGMECDIV